MATTYWQNQHPQALILPTKEGTSITIPQAGYVKDESGTYYSASFGLTSVSEPSGVTYAYTYTHQVPPPDEVGEPGGTTGQLQYNNAGEFAGIAGTEVTGSFVSLSPELAVNIVSVDPNDNGNSGLELSAQNYWRASFYSLTHTTQHNITCENTATTITVVNNDNINDTGYVEVSPLSVSLDVSNDNNNNSYLTVYPTTIALQGETSVNIAGGALKLFVPIPIYEDMTAAISGGLVNGDIFRTSTGLLGIVVTG